MTVGLRPKRFDEFLLMTGMIYGSIAKKDYQDYLISLGVTQLDINKMLEGFRSIHRQLLEKDK